MSLPRKHSPISIIKQTPKYAVIEDGHYYQIQVDRKDIPELIEKLSILISVPTSEMPDGSDWHPSCVVEDFMKQQGAQ